MLSWDDALDDACEALDDASEALDDASEADASESRCLSSVRPLPLPPSPSLALPALRLLESSPLRAGNAIILPSAGRVCCCSSPVSATARSCNWLELGCHAANPDDMGCDADETGCDADDTGRDGASHEGVVADEAHETELPILLRLGSSSHFGPSEPPAPLVLAGPCCPLRLRSRPSNGSQLSTSPSPGWSEVRSAAGALDGEGLLSSHEVDAGRGGKRFDRLSNGDPSSPANGLDWLRGSFAESPSPPHAVRGWRLSSPSVPSAPSVPSVRVTVVSLPLLALRSGLSFSMAMLVPASTVAPPPPPRPPPPLAPRPLPTTFGREPPLRCRTVPGEPLGPAPVCTGLIRPALLRLLLVALLQVLPPL
jgi:hypothetical protein